MAVSQSLSVTQSSQDIAANSSKVRIVWKSTQSGESYNNTTRTAYYYVSINGGSETRYSVSYTLPKGSTKTLVDTTITVQHKADGTGTVTVRTWMNTNISAGEVEKSQTLTLSTIPRATTPKLSASSVFMGSSVTITLDRASSSFTHDLAYQFAGGSWTSIASGVGTSRSWTVPDLATRIPNASSGTMTIRCITKNGGTTIGTKTVSMTAKVPTTAAYQPTISAVTLTEATTGLATQFKAFIQTKSKVKVAITSSGAKGSTIEKISTTFQGKTYQDSPWTSDLLASSGTLSMTTKVTDSRGRTASKTTTFSVLAYTTPRVTRFECYRVNSSGVQDTEGEYARLSYAYSVPSLNGGNTASMVIEYKESTATEWRNLQTGTALSADTSHIATAVFSSDTQYDLRIKVTDYFGASSVYPATLPSGAVIVDILADGTGIGIGKVATLPGVCDIAMQTRLQGGLLYVELPSGKNLDELLTAGLYRLPSASTYPGAPEGGVGAMLEVMGLGTIIQRWTTASKTNPRTFERSYFSGEWGDWVQTYDSEVGKIHNASASVQITTAGVDTHLNGARMASLTKGVYVITAAATFNTGSSSGTRNNQIRLIAETINAAGNGLDTTVLARQRVFAAGANFAEMQVSAIYEVKDNFMSIRVQKSSSIAEDAAGATSIRAVKIL